MGVNSPFFSKRGIIMTNQLNKNGIEMPETNARLAVLEDNSARMEKQLEKLVNVTVDIAKTQVNISSIKNEIQEIKHDCEDVDKRVRAIEMSAKENKLRIAGITTTVAAVVSFMIWWIKKRLM